MKTKYKIVSGYALIFAAWVLFGGNAANPPNAHTNAPFDEFCNQCHSGGAFNGTLEVSGVPDMVEAGQTYAATFTIKATRGNSGSRRLSTGECFCRQITTMPET